jgi:hypothetical protein
MNPQITQIGADYLNPSNSTGLDLIVGDSTQLETGGF